MVEPEISQLFYQYSNQILNTFHHMKYKTLQVKSRGFGYYIYINIKTINLLSVGGPIFYFFWDQWFLELLISIK